MVWILDVSSVYYLVVRLDLKKYNLFEDLAKDGLEWWNIIQAANPA